MTALPSHIWRYISNFLPFIDNYSLSLIKREYSNKRSFRKCIKDELSKAGFDADDFCTSLLRSGSVISGSFILRCLYNEELEKKDMFDKGTDIDVCTVAKNNDWSGNYAFFGYNPHQGNDEYETVLVNEDYKHLPLRSEKFIKVGTKIPINHIIAECKNNDIIDFINTNYDYDFCKAIFDGNKLIVSNRVKQSILHRTTIYDPYVDIQHENRGFLLRSKDGRHLPANKERAREYISGIVGSRRLKYEGRGFTIIDKWGMNDKTVIPLEYLKETTYKSVVSGEVVDCKE